MAGWQPGSAPTKKTRASKPKVRTGCQTCKVRRVKCDEQKPFCQRCRNLNLECAGYSAPVARRRKKTALAARTEQSQLSVPSGSRHSEQALPVPCHAIHSASPLRYQLEDRDVVYFDYFRHQVANNLAGFYTTSIWSRLVAGDGLQDDCIHHCILAIGASMRSMTEPCSPCSPHASGAMSRALMLNRPINTHQEAALQHRDKAATAFRRSIQYLSLSAPSKVVVATLLLAVFELLQGQLNAANSLVSSSIAFLKGFPSRLLPGCPKASGHEFREVEWVLPLLSTMSQVSHIFRPLSYSYDICMIRATVDSHLPEPDGDSLSKIFTCWGRFFTSAIIFLQQSLLYGLEDSSNSSFRQLISQQAVLLSQLQRWQAIIEECGRNSRLEPSRKIALRLPQMQWLLIHITLNCCLDSTQVMYDSYEDDFRNVCAQCKVIICDKLSHQRPTSVLLGEAVILALSIIIRCCRNHDVRMMAAEAARQIPVSMVAWDVQELLEDLLAAVLVEELGRDDSGFIPPQSRRAYVETKQAGEQSYNNPDRIYRRLAPEQAGMVTRNRLMIASGLPADICNAARCRKNHAES